MTGIGLAVALVVLLVVGALVAVLLNRRAGRGIGGLPALGTRARPAAGDDRGDSSGRDEPGEPDGPSERRDPGA